MKPDRDMLDWMLAQKSVMTPLSEGERQLVARRQASVIVAEASRQVENWRGGRPYLFREQCRPEPGPKPTLGELWDGGRRQGRRLGELSASVGSLLMEKETTQ